MREYIERDHTHRSGSVVKGYGMAWKYYLFSSFQPTFLSKLYCDPADGKREREREREGEGESKLREGRLVSRERET